MTDTSGPQEIVRLPLNKQVAEVLRREIVFGNLPAGTRLIQEELCKRFGVSRMPIRDALQQLTHEGLIVERDGQREVVALDESDIAEVHELMGVLHAHAAARVASHASDDELGQLRDLQRAVVAAKPGKRLSEVAWEFHRVINQAAGSPRLLATLNGLQRAIPHVFPMPVAEITDDARRYVTDVMNAIEAGDAHRAESLTRDYVATASKTVLSGRVPDVRGPDKARTRRDVG